LSTLRRARSLALALPGVTEEDHHRMGSFRVGGKIFATVPDVDHIRIMVDEGEIRAAVPENPDACQELYWAGGWRASLSPCDRRGELASGAVNRGLAAQGPTRDGQAVSRQYVITDDY
jgi:hypothetical protein